MLTVVNESPVESRDGAAPPGARLAAIRRERNLEIGDVAARLRLPRALIEALEADDHERLPVPSYAHGYIRSYAKLLDLDAEPLIAACADQRLPTPAVDPDVSRPQRQVSSGDIPVKLMTYSVIGTVFVLAVLWLKNEPDPSTQAVETLPTLSDGQADVVRDAGDVQLSALGYSYPEISHERMVDPPPAAVDAAEPPATEPGAAAAAPTRLALTVSEPTWIEVEDGNGTRLYYAIAQAGRSLAFGGPAPFAVVVGNAEATTVLFDGQPVDIQPFSRQRVARFTIDGDGPRTAADL